MRPITSDQSVPTPEIASSRCVGMFHNDRCAGGEAPRPPGDRVEGAGLGKGMKEGVVADPTDRSAIMGGAMVLANKPMCLRANPVKVFGEDRQCIGGEYEDKPTPEEGQVHQ